MADHTPPYLADAVARFRAAADAATAGSRRLVADAASSGAAFDRDSEAAIRELRERGPVQPGAEQTPADLRRAAAEYRESQGLPVPAFPEPAFDDADDEDTHAETEPPRVFRELPDEDDYGTIHIMRPL